MLLLKLFSLNSKGWEDTYSNDQSLSPWFSNIDSYDELKIGLEERIWTDASKLLMIRPSSLSDLHQTLTGKLEKHDKISLVVVDTINAYVRLSYMKNKEISSRQFLEMTSILQPLAEKGDYPVLITAQVYEKDGEIGPYFGKSLMHLCKTIIHLEKTKTPGLRHIRLKKHRSLPEETVEDFVLTNNGIE